MLDKYVLFFFKKSIFNMLFLIKSLFLLQNEIN